MNFGSSIGDLFNIKKELDKNKLIGPELLQGQTYLKDKKKMQKSVRRRTKLMEGFSTYDTNSQERVDVVNDKELNQIIKMQDSMDETLGIWANKSKNIITQFQQQPKMYGECVKLCQRTKDGDFLTACIAGCVGGNFASADAMYRGPKPYPDLCSGEQSKLDWFIHPKCRKNLSSILKTPICSPKEMEKTVTDKLCNSEQKLQYDKWCKNKPFDKETDADDFKKNIEKWNSKIDFNDTSVTPFYTGLLEEAGVFPPLFLAKVKQYFNKNNIFFCDIIDKIEDSLTNGQLFTWAEEIVKNGKNLKKNMSEGDFIHNMLIIAAAVPGWSLKKSLGGYLCAMSMTESKINSYLMDNNSSIMPIFKAYSHLYSITFTYPLINHSLDNKRSIVAQFKSVPKNTFTVGHVKPEPKGLLYGGQEGFSGALPESYPHLQTVTEEGVTNKPYSHSDVKMGSYGPDGYQPYYKTRSVDELRKGINYNLASDPENPPGESWGGVKGPIEMANTKDEIDNINPDGIRAQDMQSVSTFSTILKGLENEPLVLQMQNVDNISKKTVDTFVKKLTSQWQKLFKDNCTYAIGPGSGDSNYSATKFSGHQQYCKSWVNTRENRSGFYGDQWTADPTTGEKVKNFTVNTIQLANVENPTKNDDNYNNGRYGCDVLIPSIKPYYQNQWTNELYQIPEDLGGAGYCLCADGTKVYADAGHPEFSCNDVCAPKNKDNRNFPIWHDPTVWKPTLEKPDNAGATGIKAFGDVDKPEIGLFLQCGKNTKDIWVKRCSELTGDACKSKEKWPNGSGGRCQDLTPDKLEVPGNPRNEPCDTRFGKKNQCSNCLYGTRRVALTDWCCKKEEGCESIKPTEKCVPTAATIAGSATPPEKCPSGMIDRGLGKYPGCEDEGFMKDLLSGRLATLGDSGKGRACAYPLPKGGNEPKLVASYSPNGMGGQVPPGYTALPSPTELINECASVPYANIYIEILTLKVIEIVLGAKSKIMFDVLKKSNISRRKVQLKQSSVGRKLLRNIEKYKSINRQFGKNAQNQLKGMLEDVTKKNESSNISYYIWFILAISGMLLVIKKLKK